MAKASYLVSWDSPKFRGVRQANFFQKRFPAKWNSPKKLGIRTENIRCPFGLPINLPRTRQTVLSLPHTATENDANGNLYGTTVSGGAAQQGTVFKIDNAGNYSVLHSFNGSDGAAPAAGVIVGADGNLYGPCSQGGPGNGSGTGGTVFKLSLH